jgi:methyl-accepting chemotaxis protein
MNRLTLKQKLWVPLLLCWAALLIVTVVNAFGARNEQMDARRADLADVADMAVSIVADYAKQAEAGKLSVDDAKQQAIARINAQRYGASGYVTIVRSDSVMITHPMSPTLNGKDMAAFATPRATCSITTSPRRAARRPAPAMYATGGRNPARPRQAKR